MIFSAYYFLAESRLQAEGLSWGGVAEVKVVLRLNNKMLTQFKKQEEKRGGGKSPRGRGRGECL